MMVGIRLLSRVGPHCLRYYSTRSSSILNEIPQIVSCFSTKPNAVEANMLSYRGTLTPHYPRSR